MSGVILYSFLFSAKCRNYKQLDLPHGLDDTQEEFDCIILSKFLDEGTDIENWSEEKILEIYPEKLWTEHTRYFRNVHPGTMFEK